MMATSRWNSLFTGCTVWIGCALVSTAAPPAPAEWEVIGRTVENRVVEFAQFGTHQSPVLVIGPLAGDEPQGAIVAEKLAQHLVRFPSAAAGNAVAIVRDPNPDGRARRTAANAHGVLLDLNFAASRWRKIPSGDRWLSGREPESEPETRILVDLLEDLRPALVVILTSSSKGHLVQYAGPAQEIASKVALALGGRVAQLRPTEHPGSLHSLVGHDRGIPTLVVGIAKQPQQNQLWSVARRGVLAAVSTAVAPTQAAVVDSSRQEAGADNADNDGTQDQRTAGSLAGLAQPRRPIDDGTPMEAHQGEAEEDSLLELVPVESPRARRARKLTRPGQVHPRHGSQPLESDESDVDGLASESSSPTDADHANEPRPFGWDSRIRRLPIISPLGQPRDFEAAKPRNEPPDPTMPQAPIPTSPETGE